MFPTGTANAVGSGVEQVLVRLCSGIPAVQHRLNRHYLRNMEQFAAVLELASGTPFHSLARAVQPSPLALTKVDLSVQFTAGKSLESEVTLRVLNAQFQSRYGRSNQISHRIDLTVQSVPLPPGGTNPFESL